MPFLSHTSPLQAIDSVLFPHLQLWIKRDDLLHPTVSGNKFRKLKYILLDAKKTSPTLVSMGGAWSNHLHALAHACYLQGLNSVGLIRGLCGASPSLTPTLKDCIDLGMQLYFVSRDDYRTLREDECAWQNHVDLASENALWLPEGGSNTLALKGITELVAELPFTPDTLAVACGTGTTLAGLVAGMRGKGRVLGIAAVSNAEYLSQKVINLLHNSNYPAYKNFEIFTQFDHGGFAKTSPQLLQFCDDFSTEMDIPIEPIYTGKLLFAIRQLSLLGFFEPNEKIVVVHTGGLQGLRSQKT